MYRQSNIYLLLAIVGALLCLSNTFVYAAEDTIKDVEITGCGKFGSNQVLCQQKGCCWKPVQHYLRKFVSSSDQSNDFSCQLCSLGASTCDAIKFSGAPGPGFNATFYKNMYQLFLANLNIDGKGGIVAAPDRQTPGGSYYFDWMRDGALSMRTYIEINNNNLSQIQKVLKSYVSWVLKVQNEPDPNQIDVRIEPKFNLPGGSVYSGPWCRPQTDGPGLRAATLIIFANILLDNKQDDYVRKYLWTSDGSYNKGAIHFDLDWVINHWSDNGCDLWEEIRSDDFFWNRMAFRYSLQLAEAFAKRIGDAASANNYASVRKQIEATLPAHWNGAFVYESLNRQIDTAVIHAFASFPGYIKLTDPKVAATVQTYNKVFCLQYSINQEDSKKNIPGILYGRYDGDKYAGGNPWQLLTAVLGELFYQLATQSLQQPANSIISSELVTAWANVVDLKQGMTAIQASKKFLDAGDAVLYRLYGHVKTGNGHITEQISKVTGLQMAAKDLTWSFANILRALHLRQSISGQIAELTAQAEAQAFD